MGRLLAALFLGLAAFALAEAPEQVRLPSFPLSFSFYHPPPHSSFSPFFPSLSRLPLQLSVVSSGIEIHTIALSGFPQASPPPTGAGSGADAEIAAAATLPASLKDHALSRSPPPRSVSTEETLTGFIRVAVATVTFNKPVWVHRSPQAAAGADGSFASSPSLDAEDAAEAFFSGGGDDALAQGGSYGVVSTPRTASLAANTTGDLYGTVGLARLTCGRLVFDSFPAPTASHAPPRFLVPSEHISLYLSELPGVVAALPQLMACPGAGASGASAAGPGPGPGSNQLSYLLILAHSRSGLPAIEYHPPSSLSQCRLSFPPARAQGWRPTGHLAAAGAGTGASAFTGSVPLPLVRRQARERAISDLAAAAGAAASAALPMPVPGPQALARARASLSLCWPGPRGGFQGFRAPARTRLLPSDALVKRALQASAEELLGGEGRELLDLAQGGGGGKGAGERGREGKSEEVMMMEREVQTHKRSGPYTLSSAALHAPATATNAGTTATNAGARVNSNNNSKDSVWSASGFAAATAASAAPAPAPTYASAAAAAAASGSAAASRATLSPSAALDGLASSLVVHAEPWVVSLLETGSELSADAAAASMGAAGTMMMGLLSKAFSPAIKPLVPTVSTSIGQDVTGVLLEPMQMHTTTGISQGIIDLLEPMLTGEISAALVPTLIETITDEVIEGTALAVADQVAIDATPPLTAIITDKVSKAIVPIVAQNITVHTAAEIVRNCTRPLAALLPRALSHAIVPALSQTLTLSPDEHEKCYKCAVLQDPMACMVCPDDKKSQEQWGMAPSLYYAIYYTGYYSTYYSAYYADIFANTLALRGVRRREIDPNDPVPDPIGFEGDGPGQI